MSTATETGTAEAPRGLLARVLGSPWLRPLNDLQVLDELVAPLQIVWSPVRIRARVVERRAETPDCCTLRLRPNARWPGFLAGQHVGVEVELNGRRHVRRYSLTSDPAQRGDISITVKRQPGGQVSNWLHDEAAVGTVLGLQPPEGDFVLPPRLPDRLLMMSAGSGVTPLYAMLLELRNRRYHGDIAFVHVCRDGSHAIFDAALQALAGDLPGLRLLRIETAGGGRPSTEALLAAVPDYAQRLTLLCGPDPMMKPIRSLWQQQGLADKLLWERYAAVVPAAPDAVAVDVGCLRSGRQFSASTGQPLLLSAEAAGLAPRYGCRAGICHTCRYRKRSGRTENLLTGEVSEEPGEIVQLCISLPRSDLEFEDL